MQASPDLAATTESPELMVDRVCPASITPQDPLDVPDPPADPDLPVPEVDLEDPDARATTEDPEAADPTGTRADPGRLECLGRLVPMDCLDPTLRTVRAPLAPDHHRTLLLPRRPMDTHRPRTTESTEEDMRASHRFSFRDYDRSNKAISQANRVLYVCTKTVIR